jgi:hypothetical protein
MAGNGSPHIRRGLGDGRLAISSSIHYAIHSVEVEIYTMRISTAVRFTPPRYHDKLILSLRRRMTPLDNVDSVTLVDVWAS